MAAQVNHTYAPLADPYAEDALHASRLLNVEERPFQRVARAVLSALPKQLPSPPPEDSGTILSSDQPQQDSSTFDSFPLQKFREEVLLDFSTLTASLLRIQLTLHSNALERQRYAAEKAKILSAMQAVRTNTVALRAQLEQSQRALALRKGYDELAAKILNDKKLKARDECGEEIERLRKEIEDLRGESAELDATWMGRREGFDRVVGEGEGLVRVLKGVKEDVDKEGEEDDDEEDGENKGEGSSSRFGTPGDRTPLVASSLGGVGGGGETPLLPDSSEVGGTTPARIVNRFLDVEDSGTRPSSGAASPLRTEGNTPRPDVEMQESGAEEVAVSADVSAPETPALVEAVGEGVDVMDES